MVDKRMSLREAIARFVSDGDTVAMGAALEGLIPFAAGHELIRQRRRGLTFIGPISDALLDQLVGAGCVSKVVVAWAGNVSEGLGHNYRRAAEAGIPHRIQIEDHTNLTLALGLLAGALGVPYIPSRSGLGSDLPASNPTLRVVASPLDGQPLIAVPAIQPDVAVLHVQRADAEGRAHCWGALGVTNEAGLASRRIILTAEEIVPGDVILSDPNRIIAPHFKVVAVAHAPGGAHPSPAQGYYGRDHAFFGEYHRRSRTPDDFAAWLDEWVLRLPDRAAYVERLGAERWQSLTLRDHRFAATVDYGL
ncbi:MAG: CoA transferase subunit A [Chloroflexi bacterium]|nr:CoA transferase subunit A [Chloroflexota bacterium]